MKLPHALFAAFAALSAACSSGGDAPAPAPAAPATTATTQEILQDCLGTDLADIATLLDVLQNLANPESDLPLPEIDVASVLLGGGTVRWTYDLDEDGSDDLTGTLRFVDADGATFLPLGALGDVLTGGGLPDADEFLQALPDDTTVEFGFVLAGGLLDGTSLDGGDGALRVLIDAGALVSVSGDGSFLAGPCAFGFGFDDLGPGELGGGGFPVAELDFDLVFGPERLEGGIGFDGSGMADLRVRRGDDPEESFRFDLASGTVE